ncbi:MAG: S9 family peptidase [Burkholderiales bacterium]|nr:MAG: S9 family peptidase [Burkholderiales bacterium]
MTPITYPYTPTIDNVEIHFGHKISDPYRWLENDVRKDPDVARWVAAQNALTQNHLATLPGREIFRQRLAKLLDTEQLTAPIKRGQRYFFTRSSGQENQPKLCVREGMDGEDRVLLDPHDWSEDGADALGEWGVSDDGKRIAYGVQVAGTDWRTIRVFDVDTGLVLEDELQWARFSFMTWTHDGAGFFYSRYPQPAEGIASTAGVAHHAVCFHALGTPQTQDRWVYSNPAQPGALNLCDRTDDGGHLILYSTPGAGVNALAVIDLSREDWTPRVLVEDFNAEWSVIGSQGTVLYVLTSEDAERRRIVSLDLSQTHPDPVEVVAQTDAVLTSASLLGGRLLATCLVDAMTEVRRFHTDGTPDGLVALPAIGSAGGFRGHSTDNEAFFIHTSYHLPITVYRYDVARNEYMVWAQPEASADVDRMVVDQRFYTSRDGTRVPMFIVRRKDVSGPAPTLLYGYGGFGISQVPVYNPAQLAWVEQGGVMAVANIRGGGEYGRAWHMAGQLEKKQNVFDDFMAAGEFLKAEGITTPGGLAVQGESNGGLLVGTVVNQRPDLFAAALPGVGVMDMLRFHRFTGGVMWMSDFGNPDEESDFRNLLGYSPYHNIRPNTIYPAILATTADADDRVVPGHTFKYVAALQAGNLGPKPRLVRIETRAGHGAGMPLDKIIALYADMWAFAAHWTGLEVMPVE